MKKPHGVRLSKKNQILPFEDEQPLEFLAHKNDASLFMLGNHNKKRPDNVVMGRCFDFHIMDILEFGVHNFKPSHEFKANSPGLGMRPCFVFCGDDFELKPDYKRLANLFLDFFRGKPTSMINLRGLENVIVLTAVDGMVFFRHYAVLLEKSDQNFPRVELEEIGPSFDIELRRTKLCSDELWKKACVKHPSAVPKKTKNVETDTLGTKLGTVHMGRQSLTELVTKKTKALRNRGHAKSDAEDDEDQHENAEGEEKGREKKKSKK